MILDRFRLDDRVAIVTGASKGLGEVMARTLAEAGADLVICSRNQDQIEAAAQRIREATGRKVLAMAVDVADRKQVEDMAAAALGVADRIDVLVNNAGINVRMPVTELDESWDRVLAVNLTGPMNCCRAVGPHMIRRGRGRVVNVCSTLSFVALPLRASYASSKGGLIQMTRVLALEWAQHDIAVNALCPGPFATEINIPVMNDPEAMADFKRKVPLGRFGDPEEIAGAALFLASDACAYMTGSSLVVDGGWLVQ